MEEEKKPLVESKPIEKTMFEKAVGLFLSEDVNMLSDSIVDDFIKPRMKQFGMESVLKFKEFIADSLIGCIRMVIFGESANKKTGTSGSSYYSSSYTSGDSKVNYVSYYNGEPVVTTRYPGQNQPDTNNYGVELRGIKSFGEAAEVRDQLIEESKLYSRGVSVFRYYQLVGKTPTKTDDNYGWKNLDRTKVNIRSYKGHYVLDLPKPKPLD